MRPCGVRVADAFGHRRRVGRQRLDDLLGALELGLGLLRSLRLLEADGPDRAEDDGDEQVEAGDDQEGGPRGQVSHLDEHVDDGPGDEQPHHREQDAGDHEENRAGGARLGRLTHLGLGQLDLATDERAELGGDARHQGAQARAVVGHYSSLRFASGLASAPDLVRSGCARSCPQVRWCRRPARPVGRRGRGSSGSRQRGRPRSVNRRGSRPWRRPDRRDRPRRPDRR